MRLAIGLICARVDHHAGGNRIVIEGLEADMPLCADGIFQNRIEPINIGRVAAREP
jgi:hypothetical protein